MYDDEIAMIRQEILQIKVALAESQIGGFIGEPEGGGSSIPMDDDALPGCFEVDGIEGSVVTLKNCYFMVGGKMYGQATMTGQIVSGGFVALKVDAKGSSPSYAICNYSDFSTMAYEASHDLEHFIRPLYKFDDDGAVETDMRTMPTLDMIEF